MTEEFLHYLWKFKLLKGELLLSNGDKIEIIHQGTHNTDAGPDFFNAKLKIGNTVWAGNVEIHIKPRLRIRKLKRENIFFRKVP